MRPFGYDSTRMVVVAKEARVIKDAAHRLLLGESLRSIAAA
jgi:hypothetical protein